MRYSSTLRDPSRSRVRYDSEIDLSDDDQYQAVYPALDELCSQIEASGVTVDVVLLEKEKFDKYVYNVTVHSHQMGCISRSTTSWVAYCTECRALWQGPSSMAFARAANHPQNGCPFAVVDEVMES